MFQRRKHVSEVGQAILRPGLGNDLKTVRPFASYDRGPPFAIPSVEHQNGVAFGKAEHVAEIIALAAPKRERFARCQRGIDKQPGLTKVELRHGRCSNFCSVLAQTMRIKGIMHLTYRDPLAHTGMVSASSAEAGAPEIEITQE